MDDIAPEDREEMFWELEALGDQIDMLRALMVRQLQYKGPEAFKENKKRDYDDLENPKEMYGEVMESLKNNDEQK